MKMDKAKYFLSVSSGMFKTNKITYHKIVLESLEVDHIELAGAGIRAKKVPKYSEKVLS